MLWVSLRWDGRFRRHRMQPWGGAMDGKLCPPRVYIEALTPSLMVLEMGLWEVMGSDDIMSVGPSQWD